MCFGCILRLFVRKEAEADKKNDSKYLAVVKKNSENESNAVTSIKAKDDTHLVSERKRASGTDDDREPQQQQRMKSDQNFDAENNAIDRINVIIERTKDKKYSKSRFGAKTEKHLPAS
jgi:hypothetical protein